MMVLFGIAALLPWNAVLNSFDFFESKVNICGLTKFYRCPNIIQHQFLDSL